MDDRQRLREARARASWSPPGPIPPGDRGDPALLPGPGETLDAFAGHWRIFQLHGGHRFSTDDVLAAWFAIDMLSRGNRASGPSIPGRALDLGTGIGSVGFFLLWTYPDLALVGVEAQPESLALAHRTARYNGVEHRATLIEHDLRRPLPDLGTFDLVTGSPPYWNPADGRVSEGPQKGPCRFEFRGGVEAYCARAVEALAPGGLFVLVFDGRQRERLQSAASAAGLTPFSLRDVISKEGRPPLLMLAAFTAGPGPSDTASSRSSDTAGSWSSGGASPGAAGVSPAPRATPNGGESLPPLLLRTSEGRRTLEFRAIREQLGLPPGAH